MTASVETVGVFLLILVALVIGIPVIISVVGVALAEARDRVFDKWRKKHGGADP